MQLTIELNSGRDYVAAAAALLILAAILLAAAYSLTATR
jgi:hypothetical protein